jgi:hypothetical protein
MCAGLTVFGSGIDSHLGFFAPSKFLDLFVANFCTIFCYFCVCKTFFDETSSYRLGICFNEHGEDDMMIFEKPINFENKKFCKHKNNKKIMQK